MARLRKPTRLKLLEGNPGKRPLNENEPEPAPGAAMPEYLMRLPGARSQWKRWAPVLTELGVLTEVDAPAFARLCRLWAEDEETATWTDEDGNHPPPDPKLLVEIRQLEGRFGLNPSERSKIKVAPKKPESKLARFTRRPSARKR